MATPDAALCSRPWTDFGPIEIRKWPRGIHISRNEIQGEARRPLSAVLTHPFPTDRCARQKGFRLPPLRRGARADRFWTDRESDRAVRASPSRVRGMPDAAHASEQNDPIAALRDIVA